MIRKLKSKDLLNFIDYCSQYDKFSDFYITENNKRVYLNNTKNAKRVFNNCLKKGDKCYLYEEKGRILGILLIVGFSDKFHRKYVKILVNNKKIADQLFQFLNWQKMQNLFIKAKKYNPYIALFDRERKLYSPSYQVKRAGFKIIGSRDKELLLKKVEFTRNK